MCVLDCMRARVCAKFVYVYVYLRLYSGCFAWCHSLLDWLVLFRGLIARSNTQIDKQNIARCLCLCACVSCEGVLGLRAC